jgi:transcriptional regulator with XRE-family HTH domain
MVGQKRSRAAHTSEPAVDHDAGAADLNGIVAYNFRAARELRGWTQDDAAAALEPLLGQRLPQASISSIERAYEGDRRREFDAHEILAFALAFDLPMLWFFLPPVDDHRRMRRATNHVNELYEIVFGREDQLEPVYDRLRQLGVDDPDEAARTVEKLTGRPSPARRASYRQTRKQLLLALLAQHADRLDEAADELGTFFDHLRQVGVRGLVAEHLNDADYYATPDPAESQPAARRSETKSR